MPVIYATGNNTLNNLGLGHNTTPVTTPAALDNETWKKIAVCSVNSFPFSVGVKANGTLWGVGANGYKQLGLAYSTYANWTQIGSGTTWANVAAGKSHTLAIKTDGTLWASGANGNGQCGVTGAGSSVTTFTQVGTDTTWAFIAAGELSSFAIKADGTLYAWGSNSTNGLLGLGTTTASYTTPQYVGAGYESISFALAHAAAIKTDGTLWAWGNNFRGQLGRGNTTTPQTSPVQIGSAANWAMVAVGAATTHAVADDGTLWAAGYGLYYALGTGNTSNQTTITQIGSATDWKYIAAGDQYQIVVKTDGAFYVVGRNALGNLGTGGTSDVTTLTALSLSLPLSKVVSGGFSTFFGLPTGDEVIPEEPTGQIGSPKYYRLSALLRDGVAADYAFPLGSIGLSKRDAVESYYSISCPFDSALLDALTDMPDGVIHIIRDGVEWEYFNISHPVRYDIGPRGASISISGTRQSTNDEPVEFAVEPNMVSGESINSEGQLTLDLVPGFIDPRPADTITWDGGNYTITLIKFQARSGTQTLSVNADPI